MPDDLDTEDFQKFDDKSVKDYIKKLNRRMGAIEETLSERRKPITFNLLTVFAVLAFFGMPLFLAEWSYSTRNGKSEFTITSRRTNNSDIEFVKHVLPSGVGGTFLVLAIASLTKPGDRITDIVYNLLVKK